MRELAQDVLECAGWALGVDSKLGFRPPRLALAGKPPWRTLERTAATALTWLAYEHSLESPRMPACDFEMLEQPRAVELKIQARLPGLRR